MQVTGQCLFIGSEGMGVRTAFERATIVKEDDRGIFVVMCLFFMYNSVFHL